MRAGHHDPPPPPPPEKPLDPRLDTEEALAGKRPNIPLSQLTGGRAERLLSLVDRWIHDIRAHATEPEPDGES